MPSKIKDNFCTGKMDLMVFHHTEHGYTLLLSQNSGFPLYSSSRALGWPIHRK